MKLSEWRNQFSIKYKQYIEDLCEMGEDTARTLFAEAPPEYGNTEVEVTHEFDGTVNFRIIASGEDAAFLEFGTGVSTVVTRDTVQADFPIEPGSWSKENNGEFARTGYKFWHYGGVAISGTPPMGAMQQACTEMQTWSPTIAGRIFR